MWHHSLRPRVCLVCTANAFIYDDTERGSANMAIRPTGGLTLTYALVRYLMAAFMGTCTIVALDYMEEGLVRPAPYQVHLEDGSLIYAPIDQDWMIRKAWSPQ